MENNLNLKKPQIKKLTGVVLVAGLGVAIIVLAGMLGGGDISPQNPLPGTQQTVNQDSNEEYVDQVNVAERNLEDQIKGILSQIEGVGDVSVKVRLKGTARQNFAVNASSNKKNVEEVANDGGTRKTTEVVDNQQVVMVNGDKTSGEAPVVVEEVRPDIQGVVVVADGARDENNRVLLTRTVQTLLDLPANKVTVLPKKGK